MRRIVWPCAVVCVLFVASRVQGAELVAHWPMDEVKDGTLADVSGKGHDGILFGNGTPAVIDGISGKALEFKPEGEGGFTIANSESLNLHEGMTIMAWVKPADGHRATEVLCMKGDKSGDPPWPGWRLRFAWTRIMFEFGTTDGRECSALSPEWSVPSGFWSHVAATYDGKAIRVYVNAVQVAEQAVEGALAPQKQPAILANYIGRKNAYPFQGAMDDVKVFAGPLPEDEIFKEAQSR
ncbi:MAG: LamG domain-containing protein [Candidatus Hydrogenedentes bacterium]|nr:LamG domain-containing protein [Candidatus Hydrogenedentota bacterium]